ncbi:MAG TPA: hypothetical protein VEX35_03865 [Allosphingosinicella sp.]|nr:hypothetical protein [Allosphingosinicella sp.]
MNPEPGKPDREDALALIAGIERASRRSRPFFLFGLLAVILGFVSVSVYLYQDREEERAQKAELERQVAELSGTLRQARDLLPDLDDSPAARGRLRNLLREASNTARLLPAAVAAAESGTLAPAQAPPPMEKTPARLEPPKAAPAPAAAPQAEPYRGPPMTRGMSEVHIVIHIAEPSQLGPARALAGTLRSNILPHRQRFNVTSATIVSPQGNVPAGDNSVRCFDLWSCDNGERLTAIINAMMTSPRFQFRQMGGRPSGNTLITLQIWFAPGPVRVVPLG